MIRNIWAVGRNYAKHAQEMGDAAGKASRPMIFLKAGSCAQIGVHQLSLPPWSEEVHYETEMAVLLGENLKPSHIAVALDLTERKFQSEAKEKGHPWTLAKSFTGSCPIGNWYEIKADQGLGSIPIELKINSETRQSGSTSEMIFSVNELLDYLLERFPVCPGDVVLTGTPEGVGPLKKGDQLVATLGDFSKLELSID